MSIHHHTALAAVSTLEALGYTYNEGAELWTPPLGKKPDWLDMDDGLTLAQRELFTMMQEECCEVAVAVSKIKRFGLDHVDPKTGETNFVHFIKEMTDIFAVCEMITRNMVDKFDDADVGLFHVEAAIQRKLPYTKHQGYQHEDNG